MSNEIILSVLQAFDYNEEGPSTLKPEARAQLVERISDLGEESEIRRVAEQMVVLAHGLDTQKGLKTAARSVLSVCAAISCAQ